MSEVNEELIVQEEIGLATRDRTVRHIGKALKQSLKRKYGIKGNEVSDNLLRIAGIHPDFFDALNMDSRIVEERLNDASIDSNSNKSEKTISGIEQETSAPKNKAIGHDYLYREIKYLFGHDEAQRLTGEMYDYSLGISDSTKLRIPYCFSIDASRLIVEGRPFGQLPSLPVQNLRGYISCLTETIHQMSCHLAGAIAVGSFFLDVANVCMYKHKYTMKHLKRRKIRKEIQNSFQHFVHSVNMLSRNSVESPFTNISICDKTKLKNMVKEMEFMFDINNLPCGFIKKMFMKHDKEYFYKYLVDYIYELQNVYLDFFDKGAPSLNGAPYRFPVTTLCLSKHKNEKGEWEVTEEDTLDDFCEREIYRYNVFASEGSKVASCCRLINDAELMENYAAQSNSFGAGGSISLGSHRVVTINLPRIALEAKDVDDFFVILDGRIKDAAKILKAHKALIKRLTDAGLQPFISNGWIKLDRMFSTFGIIGTYETASALEKRFGNDGEIDIQGVVLKFFNERVMAYSKEFNIAGNIEQIPGESFAVRLRSADELIFGKEKMDSFYPEPLYSNQPIPLWHEADVWERLQEDGKYNSLITGGGIVHATIGERVTKKQAKSIIRYSVKTGCEHFALNSIYSKCKDGHMTFGKSNTCPTCGAEVVDWFTRVVGFFVPVSAMNKTRREWEFPRRKMVSIDNK
jgi:ribonucleoside-triphosphate reductase